MAIEELYTKEELYGQDVTAIDNDFVGFTFGDKHSSNFNILRTSEGSRFNENLLPTTQDKTVQVPGGDGMYYFGSYYGTKIFNIQFAFERMTELQFRDFRNWLGDRQIRDLIFDEAPYKVYRAKITGNSTIRHICFEEEGNRVYKGEGSIQFTCYNPFARSRKNMKFLEDYDANLYPTKHQWRYASGMLNSSDGYDTFSNSSIKLYNAGDLETDFTLVLTPSNTNVITLEIANCGKFTVKDFVLANSDAKIRINTKTKLIEGIKEDGTLSGSLYNQYIFNGDFFKIPLGESILSISNVANAEIKYDYLYF